MDHSYLPSMLRLEFDHPPQFLDHRIFRRWIPRLHWKWRRCSMGSHHYSAFPAYPPGVSLQSDSGQLGHAHLRHDNSLPLSAIKFHHCNKPCWQPRNLRRLWLVQETFCIIRNDLCPSRTELPHLCMLVGIYNEGKVACIQREKWVKTWFWIWEHCHF